jgi:hypothetical protein
LISSLQAISVKAPQLPLYTASCEFKRENPKLVEISTEGEFATKLNQIVLLILLGDQQGGVGGLPTVVAPTFVYSIEEQLPLVTGKVIAPLQASFDGCA